MSTDLGLMADETSAPWATRPGWGIAVDLLPREILQGRRSHTYRIVVVLAMAVVLLACAGAVLLSMADRSSSQSSYDDALTDTARLKAESAKYDDVTAATTVIKDTETQVGSVMAQDVDVVNLIARIRSALPKSVTISNLAVLLAPPTADAAQTTAGGNTVVGSITIAGGGDEIKDLAPFVANLNHLRGVVQVVPGSTSQSETGMAYSMSLNFTDALYSHRFDPKDAQ